MNLTLPRTALAATALLFGALSAVALWQHGYVAIFAMQFQNAATAQVLADLVIALSLVMIWLWQDARTRGRNPGPWIVATALLGSFGPLGYLLTRK
ncbi:MAG: DUF2834 domain-containing protein [Betaproteobacteria bacterium]|nr:DUF2834 domain-containing protein [Betaproteobacteria bacterium]